MNHFIYFLLIFVQSIPALGNSDADKVEFFLNESNYDSAVYFYTKEINTLENKNKNAISLYLLIYFKTL